MCLMSIMLCTLNSGYSTTPSNYVYSKKIVKKSTVNNNKIGSQNNNIKYSNTTQESSNKKDDEWLELVDNDNFMANELNFNNNEPKNNDFDISDEWLEEPIEKVDNDTFMTDELYDDLFSNKHDMNLLQEVNKKMNSKKLYEYRGNIYDPQKRILILKQKELEQYKKIRERFLNTIYYKLKNNQVYLDNNHNVCIQNTRNILVNADELKCYKETGKLFCNVIYKKISNKTIITNENEVIDKKTGKVLCNYQEWNLYNNTKEMLQKLSELSNKTINSDNLALRKLLKNNLYMKKRILNI